MPATPSQLRRPIVVDHTIDFGDGATVLFRFDRNKITDAWLQEWSRLEEDRNVSAINEVLADLIVSWDVQNEDGTPYPLTAEAIGFLFNLPDKSRIVQELMRASVPGEAEGKASPATSVEVSPASSVTETPSPNGAPTSTLQPVSASPSPT